VTTTPGIGFEVQASDGLARAGELRLERGTVHTPCFMPVGTLGSVKGLTPNDVAGAGARIILANAYHLALRPGSEVLRSAGGLHRFMGWAGPLLTDSGGFQVFSLARINSVDDEGVSFRSHLDGGPRKITPEISMEIQSAIGGDIWMAFDQCPPGEASRRVAREAVDRSLAWLSRCRNRWRTLAAESSSWLWPVVQGASFSDLRRESLERTLEVGDWTGIGIGGLSVGEPREVTLGMLDVLAEGLPADRPRYLMGVGYPDDMVEAVGRGVDMFDCVAATRNGRTGTAFTRRGHINIKGARFADDQGPVDLDCDCECCTNWSRAYLRHLFVAREMLGPRLLSLHNIRFLVRLMENVRAAIQSGRFDDWAREWRSHRRRPG